MTAAAITGIGTRAICIPAVFHGRRSVYVLWRCWVRRHGVGGRIEAYQVAGHVKPMTIAVIAVLAVAAFARTDDWQDTQHLTRATLNVDSQSAAGNFIAASDAALAGNWDQSLPYYQSRPQTIARMMAEFISITAMLLMPACGKFSEAIAEFETAACRYWMMMKNNPTIWEMRHWRASA